MSSEKPISAVLQDIVRNIQDIVRSEVRLAKAEVREELAKTRAAGLLLAVGAVMGLCALIFALLACVYALSLVLAPWAAALCVTAAVGVAAGLAIRVGLTRFKDVHAVPKAVASIKENIEWAQQQIK
jgi:uncharacterized membrane protein YqjE